MSEAQTVLAARDLSRHYSVSQGFGKPKATVRALNGVSFEFNKAKPWPSSENQAVANPHWRAN